MFAKATFGAGCFWGVEKHFRQMSGVVDTCVGYMGGHVENPDYQQVCAGDTGHTEVCQVEFDPDRISYGDLVQAFFEIHDPTQVNRQGADVGRQYRSVIFVHDHGQEQIARQSLALLAGSGRFRAPIATAIEPAATFWKAEDYHQQYLSGERGCAVSSR